MTRPRAGAAAEAATPDHGTSREDTRAGWWFLVPFLVVYLVFLLWMVGWRLVGLSVVPAMWLRQALVLFFGVIRTLFFAPYVLSVAVLTLIWAFLLNPQQGLIGSGFEAIGLEPINWINSTSNAVPAIVITTAWWTVDFNIVLFLADLQAPSRGNGPIRRPVDHRVIDPTQYQAASVDGANTLDKRETGTTPGRFRDRHTGRQQPAHGSGSRAVVDLSAARAAARLPSQHRARPLKWGSCDMFVGRRILRK